MALLSCKINKENQFIDFRLITQSRKNDAFILLCHQPQRLETNLSDDYLWLFMKMLAPAMQRMANLA